MGKLKENQEILKLFQGVHSGSEKFFIDPPMMPEAHTLYAFSFLENRSKAEDWRADGYRWRQNGSKNIKYNDHVIKKTYFNVYTAPKISSKGFQRISYHCQEFPGIVIVSYKGDHTIAGKFPHGNSRHDERPFSMTRKSVIEACRNSVEDPVEIYESMTTLVNRSCPLHSVVKPVPRSVSQIQNLQRAWKHKKESICNILQNMQALAYNTSFIVNIELKPNLVVILHCHEMLDSFSSLLNLETAFSEQMLFHKSVLIHNYEISTLTYKNKFIADADIPIMFFVSKLGSIDRNVILSFFRKMIQGLPEEFHLECNYNTPESLRDFLSSEPFSTIVQHLRKWDNAPLDAMLHLKCNAMKLHELSSYFIAQISHCNHHLKRDFTPKTLEKIFADGFQHNSLVQYKYPVNKAISKVPKQVKFSEVKLYQLAKIIDCKNISLDLSTRSFILVEDQNTRTITLFPKETCTCGAKSLCHHIIACKMSLGIIDKDAVGKSSLQLSSLIDTTNKTGTDEPNINNKPMDLASPISIEDDMIHGHQIMEVSSEIVIEADI